MQGNATGHGPSQGAEEHAEIAWQKLQTPGEGPDERAEAIEAFAHACRAIEERGPDALTALAELAAAPDPANLARAMAAARILAEVGTTEAAAALVRIAFTDDILIAGRALAALPSMRISQAAQALLVDAVRGSTEGAEGHRKSLLADGLGRQLVTGADFEATSWAKTHPLATVRAAWARALARAGGATASLHLRSMIADPDVGVRLWAAFGLTLEGDVEMISELVRGARSRRSDERAAAVGLLGVVPLPDVVTPVLAATSDRSPLVARAAIVRAGHLGVRASLLAISEQLENKRTDVLEQAAWTLRDFLGEDPGFVWVGRRLTPASAASVRARCRALHESWAPRSRYLRGRPMTAASVAGALDGAGGRDPQAAYFTLLGMCGCSYGYDPGADEVANRAPIKRLRQWAHEHGQGLTPGAFYFRREPTLR